MKIGKEEIEYCIWNKYIGRMDSSTDWKYLYDLGSKHINSFPDKSFSIIPVESVGKGDNRTYKEIIIENEKKIIEIMERHKKNMREHEEFMKEHEEFKKKYKIGEYSESR